MVRVYIKTCVGEFNNEVEAQNKLDQMGYIFDEDIQPVFEEVEE